MANYLFTSESVTEGHPDKICDQISDAVLDAILAKDPLGRVACETTASTGLIHIMGEISTKCYVDIPKIAREVIRGIGYDRAKYGFDCDTCGIITNIDEQSADIALGVDKSFEAKAEGESELDNGAGDQGMMFTVSRAVFISGQIMVKPLFAREAVVISARVVLCMWRLMAASTSSA